MSSHEMPPVGTKVILKEDVDRFPHAFVKAGATGTVTMSEGDEIYVTLDKKVGGLKEWDNALEFSANVSGPDVDFLADFWDHVDHVEPTPAPRP